MPDGNVGKPIEGEIIIKLGHLNDESSNSSVAVLQVCILADAEGYAWLGKWFSALSDECVQRAHIVPVAVWDNAEAASVMSVDHRPFNWALSDRVELRCGLLTPGARDLALEKHNVTAETAQHGGLETIVSQLAEKVRAGDTKFFRLH